MRPGWNPTRRSRTIGTPLQGRGRHNRLVIPAPPPGAVFWEVLRRPVTVRRQVGAAALTFLVEPPRPDAFHACTLDHICQVLELVPPKDLSGIDLVVLRQPTRKQAVLSSVWGRLAYQAEIGPHSGVAIFLEAQTGAPIRWSRSLRVEARRELDRLRGDGHRVRETRRHIQIEPSPGSIRATQLYRTLLHEVGHYVDYLTRVLLPSADPGSRAARARLERAYFARPHRDREEFAHAYAARLGRRVRRFAPSLDPARLRAEGLDPSWFRPRPVPHRSSPGRTG